MSNTGRLRGKTALVTGGAKRLGRAICLALAQDGANIILHYNASIAEAEDTAQDLRKHGGEVSTLSADLSDPEQAKRLFSDALEIAPSVDILINNASIFPADRLDALSLEGLTENLNINAFSPLVLSTAFAKQNRPGTIINLLDARIVDYDKEHVSYHLSKRVLHTLTCMMALEYAPTIRVNALAPGLILPPEGKDEEYLKSLADSNPLNTHGTADQVAEAVLFLLNAEFITGQVIYIDGGRHLKGHLYA